MSRGKALLINPAYLGEMVVGCTLLAASGVYVPHVPLLAITLTAFRCEFVDSAFGMVLDGYQSAYGGRAPRRATENPHSIAAVRRQSADG